MRIAELIEQLKSLEMVYGNLPVKVWPCKYEDGYKDCEVIVAGVQKKVLLVDEDGGSEDSERAGTQISVDRIFNSPDAKDKDSDWM